MSDQRSGITVSAVEAVERIKAQGPTRIIINEHAEGRAPARCSPLQNKNVSIIFIRDDGWTLGAPPQYEELAYSLYHDTWTGFVRKPDFRFIPIAQY